MILFILRFFLNLFANKFVPCFDTGNWTFGKPSALQKNPASVLNGFSRKTFRELGLTYGISKRDRIVVINESLLS